MLNKTLKKPRIGIQFAVALIGVFFYIWNEKHCLATKTQKCCFPLAEGRNKRKTYFSQGLGAWVLVCGVVRGTKCWVCSFSRCKTFKTSSMTRHKEVADHKHALSAGVLNANFEAAVSKAMKVVYWLALHTAYCERAFSAQNLILTKLRNRLAPGISDKLLRVRILGKGLKLGKPL